MTILVTGATGFIGSQLCRKLVADGHRVRAFHRPKSSLVGLEGLPVEHASGDITRPETLKAAMQGVEYVFHTAAMVGSPRRPQGMHAVNVEGTRNVLQAASEAGVRRVIHTSSVAALGVPTQTPRMSPLLMDERHTWNESPEGWRYGYTKYLAEMEVQRAVAQGLDVVIVNPAVVVGAGDLNQVSGNVLVFMARYGLPFSTSGGMNVVHIADVVRGHLSALTQGQKGQRYILGGENLPHSRFLHMAAEVLGRRPPRVVLPGRVLRQVARPAAATLHWLPLPLNLGVLRRAGLYFYYDTTRARLELNLTQPRSTREAITDACAWYRQCGVIR